MFKTLILSLILSFPMILSAQHEGAMDKGNWLLDGNFSASVSKQGISKSQSVGLSIAPKYFIYDGLAIGPIINVGFYNYRQNDVSGSNTSTSFGASGQYYLKTKGNTYPFAGASIYVYPDNKLNNSADISLGVLSKISRHVGITNKISYAKGLNQSSSNLGFSTGITTYLF